MSALRHNNDKPQLSEILKFGSALDKVAKVMELGAVKYEQDNWLKGGKPDQEYLDSCVRHLKAFIAEDEYDEDSGCHHIAHAAWNLLALLRLNRDDAPELSPDFDLDAFMERWGEAPEPVYTLVPIDGGAVGWVDVMIGNVLVNTHSRACGRDIEGVQVAQVNAREKTFTDTDGTVWYFTSPVSEWSLRVRVR